MIQAHATIRIFFKYQVRNEIQRINPTSNTLKYGGANILWFSDPMAMPRYEKPILFYFPLENGIPWRT